MSEWKCTVVDGDGVVCGKKARVKSTRAGVVSYTCDYCDRPTCELCHDRPGVGWGYTQFKSPPAWTPTYMCSECLPWRRSARHFGNPYAMIEGWTPAVQPGEPRPWCAREG